MKSSDILAAMTYVGSDFVEEAEFGKLGEVRKGTSKRFVSILIAAALVLSLGVAAYAGGFFGLSEYLSKSGLETGTVNSLTTDLTENTVSYKNSYAEYTVLEATADSHSIYIMAKVEPLDDNYFLVSETVFEDDSVALLGIPGLENENTTIGEYVESRGKTYVQVSLGCKIGDVHVTEMKDFSYDEDGTLYLYAGSSNITENETLDLTCVGTAVTGDMSLADRVEFEVQLDDKSSKASKLLTEFDSHIYDETGVKLNSIRLEETEIGLYVIFEFENDGSITSKDGTWFKLCDSEGNEFKFFPGMGGAVTDNGDGSFTETISYQKPASFDGMTIALKDIWDGVYYGPYQLIK